MKKSDTTYISFYLRSNTMRIFKKTIRGLGIPQFFRFRVSPTGTSMLLEEFDRITLTSFRVPKNIEEVEGSLEVHSKPFCRLMAHMQGWDISKSYRVPGRVFKAQNVVVFDLTQAVEITEHNRVDSLENFRAAKRPQTTGNPNEQEQGVL